MFASIPLLEKSSFDFETWIEDVVNYPFFVEQRGSFGINFESNPLPEGAKSIQIAMMPADPFMG